LAEPVTIIKVITMFMAMITTIVHLYASCGYLTADFSVIDPYRMMPTDSSAEKPTRPIVHA
jgi:hypothetical protein